MKIAKEDEEATFSRSTAPLGIKFIEEENPMNIKTT